MVGRKRWRERGGREWWNQGLGLGFQVRWNTWWFFGGHRRTVVPRKVSKGAWAGWSAAF